MKRQSKAETEEDYSLTLGICLGLCSGITAGIMVWAVTDKILWLPLFTTLGLAAGIAISNWRNPDE